MKHVLWHIIMIILILSVAGSVSAVEITAGDGTITASDVPEVSTLITALYCDGVMKNVKMHFGSETIIANPADDFGVIDATDTIKAFLWNMNTLTPVCNSFETNAEELNKADNKVTITINGQQFTATLYDNETAKAFQEMLPITITMNELNGNEKYHYFNNILPTNATRPGTIHEGDLMLYGSSCLVLFYETFQSSYSYTPIGYIEDPAGLQSAVGGGSVTVHYE